MTRISLAEEYDNRDMVAQMIALKNRQTESENNLLTYVAQCAQSASDAEDAKDDAEAARDTAVAAATDTVRKTPSAAQTITGYKLTVTQGVTANLTGNVTGNVTGNLTGNVTGNVTGNATTATTATKLGSTTVGTALKPIFINAGTATVCNEMCDLVSPQTVTGVKTFSASPVVPTVATGTADTKAANGTKVKNELDAYSPMVRTTGTQTVAGVKSFISPPLLQIGGGGIKIDNSLYLRFGAITSVGNTTYNVDLLISERTALSVARAAITVSGGAVTGVAVNGKTMYGASTYIYVGAAMENGEVALYCHTSTTNRYVSPTIFGAYYSNGNPLTITPDNTTVAATPSGYAEGQFTEA